MNDFDNVMLLTDSYKFSHYKQYPKGAKYVHAYFESRGGKWPSTMFFGLQYFLKRYLEGVVVTAEKIEEAEALVNAHLGPGAFNREGWEYILNNCDGKLPVHIEAVPEGTLVPNKNVLMTITNTDPNVPWLVNYLETLLVQVWYPSTVATNSYTGRQIIKSYLKDTGGIEGLDFKYHDFGFRGVSSVETAGLGCMAHLATGAMGTDTTVGLILAKKYYGEPMAGFSIPATEHSTVTSHGKNNEEAALGQYFDAYPSGLFACVADSYDFYGFCHMVGKKFYERVMNREGTFVVRPDSGKPSEVVLHGLQILGQYFTPTINERGYKVLPPQIRMIQGDGVDNEEIDNVLGVLQSNGWSADNVAFGSGGALLQKVNRDTQKFAFKASYIEGLGEDSVPYAYGVSKCPIDAPWKKSKEGRLALYRGADGEYITMERGQNMDGAMVQVTRPVFVDGKLIVDDTFANIRARASQ